GVASRVIPNAVAVSAFESTEPRRMGRIFCASTPEDDRKRVPFLVDAFAQIHARNSETELVIAGRASDACREQLRARAPECAGSIRFVGEVTGAELVSLYSSAAVTCLPSLHEAFGMVVIESMAAGTPVVASHHGALPELVDDSVGATFPSDDVDACAVALEAVLERWADPARAQACVERARTYDWSVVGPQFLDVYEEVAS
ncbi:MAG TPA: glycosyltransferase family 4 protein, partial [Acidimicrobiales bacterium]|nr:glycosyltransferase family 4 protein [Acidimicrobiales bacterium]